MRKVHWMFWGLAPLMLVAIFTKFTSASPTTKPVSESQPSPTINTIHSISKPNPQQLTAYRAYRHVITQTVSMVGNPDAQRLARQLGLNILDLTWEDTGRYKGSAVGSNISDMTIQVQQRNPATGQYELSLMPLTLPWLKPRGFTGGFRLYPLVSRIQTTQVELL